MEYWHGMVMCKRKALCHITHKLCLETHDLNLCGDCPNFMNILRHQEEVEWEQAHRQEQFDALKTAKKKGGRR